MPIPDDVMLIIERDPESLALLRRVAENLGADRVESESAENLEELLALRRPTLVILAIECLDASSLPVIRSLRQGVVPPILLLGSGAPRILSSAKRTLESYGLNVFGVAERPLTALAAEQLIAPRLSKPVPISLEEFERAFTEHELLLQYQPKIAIAPEEPTVQGVEALVRWQHPRRGLLQPLNFLGAIEELGLMASLTDYVMGEAVGQVGRWLQQDLELEMVVNLNPRLIRDLAFPERLAQLLREHGVPPSQLVLDVTESPSIADRDLMLSVFTRLRILGIGLSLDNFGTGLSSLTELYKLPFSEVKVDHAIMGDLPHESEARFIVQAIADLVHGLDMSVCAEGVESRQTLEFVRRAGFDSAQGRFFSGPVDAADIERLVRAWPSAGPAATGTWPAMRPAEFSELKSGRRRRFRAVAGDAST